MQRPTAPKAFYNHPAAIPDDALIEQCVIGHSRASGPGGQHRNKVSTQVTLTHQPTGLAATAGERRSQSQNKSLALRRLRLKLATEHREPVPDGEIGSELLRSRITKPKRGPGGPTPKTPPKDPVLESLGVKLRPPEPNSPKRRLVINPEHRDYPAILAEVLDAVAAAGWELATAATRFGVSQSQLLKLIKHHTHAFGKLNEERESRGKHPMH